MSQKDVPHRPAVGVLLKLGSVALISGVAACVKYLGEGIPAGQTIFVRGVVSVALLALLASRMRGGLRLLTTKNWRAHALRSLAGTASMFCWFSALTLIPFADFTAISFTAPLFLTILAMLFLGERIHRYRWSALAIGFAGVLITIGPHLTLGGRLSGVLLALAGAAFSALAMLFLRSMSRGGAEHALTITFYFSLTSLVVGGLTAFGGWPKPTPTQWLFIGLVSIFGVLGQLMLSWAYRYAEASTIAPLDYVNLVVAVLFGYAFFAETPSGWFWIGAPLVIGAAAIIFWREYRPAAAPPAPLVAPNP